jgi:PHD/YefM family antitoxin component YafN of YafNO toxin-antitoxin module
LAFEFGLPKIEREPILRNMADTFTVSEAQANLPKLVKQDSFSISRHGKVVGVYLSKDRIEAMIETMELLGDKKFIKAIRDYEAGRAKFKDFGEVFGDD